MVLPDDTMPPFTFLRPAPPSMLEYQPLDARAPLNLTSDLGLHSI